MTQPTPDNPISPNHYARYKIQPLDFINANELGFSVGNVIKYVCRYTAKDGLQDLEKARSYLDRLIADERNKGRPASPGAAGSFTPYLGPRHPETGARWSTLKQSYEQVFRFTGTPYHGDPHPVTGARWSKITGTYGAHNL